MIAKAKQRLHDEMSAWPLEARRPGEISPAEDAALRELLVKGHTRSVGLPLPQEFVDRVKDPYTLYAIGVLLLSPLRQRSLLVETEYGLTNRLRAYGSAKLIADATARQLVVLWVPNAHCYAKMGDMFQIPKSVVVVDDPIIREVAKLADMQSYDLMAPGNKMVQVDGRTDKNIYIRSAFRVNTKVMHDKTESLHMRYVP